MAAVLICEGKDMSKRHQITGEIYLASMRGVLQGFA